MSATARHAAPRIEQKTTDDRLTALLVLVVGWAAAGLCGLLILNAVVSPEPSAPPVVARPAAQTLPAYTACELALAAEHARWQYSGTSANPAACNQPTVTAQQYIRAWTSVGGETWTLQGDTSAGTHAQN